MRSRGGPFAHLFGVRFCLHLPFRDLLLLIEAFFNARNHFVGRHRHMGLGREPHLGKNLHHCRR